MPDIPSPRYPTPNYDLFASILGNLPNVARQAQSADMTLDQQRMKLGQEKAFQDGLPMGPDGMPDVAAIMSTLAKTGDINAIGTLMPTLLQQRELKDAGTVSPLLGGGGGAAPGPGASNGGGGRLEDTLAQVESGGRNIPSTVDPDVSGPGTRSQGFYQINVPTWKDFAGKAGVDLSQYPTPMSAPREVQERVADAIPFARFGKRTRDALEKKYGFGEDARNLTIGELSRRAGGGGEGGRGGEQYASLETDAPTAPPTSVSGGSMLPRSASAYAPASPTMPMPGQGGQSAAPGPAPQGMPLSPPQAAPQPPQAPQGAPGAPGPFGGLGGAQQAFATGGTLSSIVSGSVKDPQKATVVAANIAKVVGVNPNAPMTPEQATKAQGLVQGYLARTGQQQAQQAPQPGPQQAQNGQPQGRGPIVPQVPLPKGFTDPQQAILAIDREIARLAANPRAGGQVKALEDYRNRIAASVSPMEVKPGQTFLDPRTGQPIYQSPERPVAVGGALVRPSTGEVVYQPQSSMLDDTTIKQMAEQYRMGDTSVMQNLGRGVQGAQNIVRLREEIARQNAAEGVGGSEQAMKNAEFFGVKSGQRTIGGKQANIEMAATEFKQVVPIVQEASRAVSRTNYPALNKIIQAGEEQTGDPRIVAFGSGVNTLVNLYARAISPSGTPTVSDKEHARDILSKAWSQGQFDSAVSMMQKEIDAALNSPEKVRDEMRKRFTGKSQTEPAPAKSNDQPKGAEGGLPAGWSVEVH